MAGDPSTPEGLLAALAGVDMRSGRASYYVRAWTPIAKIIQSVTGNGRQQRQERMGEPGE